MENRMTTAQKFITIGLLVLGYAVTIVPLDAKELTERDVTTLVTEYLTTDTAEKRQSEILSELKTAKAIFAQKTLTKFLTDESKRPQALKLAVELRVPGLCETVKKYIETVDSDQVIKYIFSLQDTKGLEFLYDYWRKSDTQSAAFININEGFKAYSVGDVRLLDKFYGEIEDETRGEMARNILYFQLDVTTKDPAYLKNNWKKLRKEYAVFAKTFPTTGMDLLLLPEIKSSNSRMVGKNYSLKESGELLISGLPDSIQTGNFILKANVYIGDGDGFQMWLCDNRGQGWRPTARKEEWFIETFQRGSITYPLKRNDWNLLEWHVTDESQGNQKFQRGLKLLINGKLPNQPLACSGEFGYVAFKSGGGWSVIGGVELIKK